MAFGFRDSTMRKVPLQQIAFDTTTRMEGPVEDLLESIKETGQILQPVLLRKTDRGNFFLLSGKRRLRAARELGMQDIPAMIMETDDLHAELATIDENLIRLPLSSVDFEEALARRKVIYLELHPETAQHVAGGIATAEGVTTPSFTLEVARKLGVTQRTIEKAVARSAQPEIVKRARREKRLTTVKADILGTLPPEQQARLLDLAVEKDTSVLRDVVENLRKGAPAEEITKPESTPSKFMVDLRKTAKKLFSQVQELALAGAIVEDRQTVRELKTLTKAIKQILPHKNKTVRLAPEVGVEERNATA